MESCWYCEVKQRSNEFDQMYASAEACNNTQGLRRIKGQHRRFLEAAYTVDAYDRQDGYSVHRDRWLETGDLAEIDRMLSHPLPNDSSKVIEIIPLQPKTKMHWCWIDTAFAVATGAVLVLLVLVAVMFLLA